MPEPVEQQLFDEAGAGSGYANSHKMLQKSLNFL
jgi:lysozyme family protein